MDRIFGNTSLEYKIKKGSSNPRGFIAMTLLLFVPLFISIFLLSFAFLLTLKNYNQAYFLCYKTGAKIQKTLQGSLKTLIRMNTQAGFLRLRRSVAEWRYKTSLISLEPVNILKARQALQEVKQSQKSFARKQEEILKQAQRKFQAQWTHFKFQSKKYMKKVKKTFALPPLAVQKEPPDGDSPGYAPVQNFSENQKITISWVMDGFALLPRLLSEKLGLKGVSTHHCSVSLEGSTRGFHIKLMK